MNAKSSQAPGVAAPQDATISAGAIPASTGTPVASLPIEAPPQQQQPQPPTQPVQVSVATEAPKLIPAQAAVLPAVQKHASVAGGQSSSPESRSHSHSPTRRGAAFYDGLRRKAAREGEAPSTSKAAGASAELAVIDAVRLSAAAAAAGDKAAAQPSWPPGTLVLSATSAAASAAPVNAAAPSPGSPTALSPASSAGGPSASVVAGGERYLRAASRAAQSAQARATAAGEPGVGAVLSSPLPRPAYDRATAHVVTDSPLQHAVVPVSTSPRSSTALQSLSHQPSALPQSASERALVHEVSLSASTSRSSAVLVTSLLPSFPGRCHRASPRQSNNDAQLWTSWLHSCGSGRALPCVLVGLLTRLAPRPRGS